jgi:histidinol-phosphatase (PHP family)
MFDCHMHTRFSTDSRMEPEEACITSIGLGLDGIAVTDHLDFDYPGGESFVIDFDEYFSQMETLAEKYKGKLKVLKAMEVGIQPHVIDESLNVINSYPFDYILASVHIIDRADPYKEGYFDGKTKSGAYGRYLEEILFMISNLKSFDMVAHFEYIIRRANYADRTLRYADHSDLFDLIFKKLIELGRGFELNTATFRRIRPDAEYDIRILQRYRELGGEMICLGSDAHQAAHIGARFDYYAQIIREAGFEYTVHFEDRKPIFDKL